MVRKLMRKMHVSASTTLLDPGCGEGEFIAGVLRWCAANGKETPRILGIEQHPGRASEAKRRFRSNPEVRIESADFLVPRQERFDLIIGNPPYVSLGHLSSEERASYRERYQSARGRFDLYMLFFEQALRLLKPTGRLVFVTPEKFTYVESARALRRLLLERALVELHFVDESSFDGFVTYPVVTTIGPQSADSSTEVLLRSGERHSVRLRGENSWQSTIRADGESSTGPTVADICVRVSCGIATGADAAFVVSNDNVARELRRFAHPTVAGRQIRRSGFDAESSLMLVPYDRSGALLPESRLGALGRYLGAPERKVLLTARTCAFRKPWYAFHDNAPLEQILRPKILCKDITAAPFFVSDDAGTIVPRHSTYYMVPNDPAILPELVEYLNSTVASRWLLAHCQRAANGFIRLQSGVLKRLPVPDALATTSRAERQLEFNSVAIPA